MRFRIFDPITSAEEGMPLCNLGHLFNAYAARLSSLEVAAYPQESLSEYHRLTVGKQSQRSKANREKARVLRAAEQEFYCLAVLNNSLHDLHLCVLGACNMLTDLFNLYDGDLRRYAIQNRLRCIAETVPGTEEEMAEVMTPEDLADYQAEWELNPDAGAEGPTHRVKYKDDEQSLAPYTVLADLSHYFAPLHEHYSIETIGSSFPEDFAYFTDLVRTYSEKHKTSHISPTLTVYRRDAVGEYVAQSFAQQVENEVNDEMKDQRVASHFNQILRRMHYVAGLSVMLTDAASYRELLDELVAIRDCTGLHEPTPIF